MSRKRIHEGKRKRLSGKRGISYPTIITLIAVGIIIPGLVVASYYSRIQPLNGTQNQGNNRSSRVLDSISYPATAFTYDPFDHIVYAIGSYYEGAHAIIEINATSNEILQEIPLPLNSKANSIAYDPDNRELYYSVENNVGVSQPSYNFIALNSSSGMAVMNASLPVFQLSIDYVHNLVFALDINSFTSMASVSVLSGSNNSVLKNITVESVQGKNLGCCFEGGMIYAPKTNFLYQSLAVSEPNGTLQATTFAIALGNDSVSRLSGVYGTNEFAYDPYNGFVLASNTGYFNATYAIGNQSFFRPGDNISIFDRTSPVAFFHVGYFLGDSNETLGSIAFDSEYQKIYVASGEVTYFNGYRFDPNFLVTVNSTTGREAYFTSVPDGIVALFVNPVNHDVYVATPSFIYAMSIP